MAYDDQETNNVCPTGFTVAKFIPLDSAAAAGSTYTFNFNR
jgi:hypothetical protein